MQEAYTIGNITVKDEVKWAEYKSKVSATVVPQGGELVFRGEKLNDYSGKNNHAENVIIKFPNQQALDDWFQSDAYQALIPIREMGADIDLVSYQSVS